MCITVYHWTSYFVLGKPQKKVIFLMTVPLRGGGGKALAIKKKIAFWKLNFGGNTIFLFLNCFQHSFYSLFSYA